MSDSKEFQGKNLDEAIEAACKHFDLKRDKLEIEIVSGGSSGIFGLVGVKKAVVRAKPRGSFKSLVAESEPEAAPRAERTERSERTERAERPKREPRPEPAPAPAQAPAAAAAPAAAPAPDTDAQGDDKSEPQGDAADGGEKARRSRRGRSRGRGDRGDRPERSEQGGEREAKPAGEAQIERGSRRQRPRTERPERGERGDRPERGERGDRLPRATIVRGEREGSLTSDDEDSGAPQGIAHLDQALLEATAREVTQKLLTPLVQEATLTVELQADRVCLKIEDPTDSGLLIGREGQTLAAIQYLVNRLVSKRMDASVRVQIDAGDYRENQDERLRQIARHLAEKAIATGRTQSTRPMSSYHRRVVHLTLQDHELVFTRSKGEGSMKRVLIMTKRKGKNGELVEDAEAAQQNVDMPEDNAAE